jgi:hypothetical protein
MGLERNKWIKKAKRLPTFNLSYINKNSDIHLTRSSLKLFNLVAADIFKDDQVLVSGIFGQHDNLILT